MLIPQASHGEQRLAARLGLSEEHGKAFIAALRSGTSSCHALVLTPRAGTDYHPPFPCQDTSAWSWLPPRVFLPYSWAEAREHPDFKAGLYYALDLSSCWESAALSLVPPPRRSLDVCAAPGGKTMLMLARFGAQEHTANEVNAARRGILRQNLEMGGASHVRVTGLRPDQWGRSGEQFDLLLVDAPCSGQSLLAKGVKNPGCLSPTMVNGNAKRQKGILLSMAPCVISGGHLLYTTCTYDPEENEKVMAYIIRRIPGWQAVPVPALASFRSSLCAFPAYRMLPTDGIGAGGFCCLLRKD